MRLRMSRRVGKNDSHVVVLRDDLEEFSCPGPQIIERHEEKEFDLFPLKLLNARAYNCPVCGTRYVSFITTFVI